MAKCTSPVFCGETRTVVSCLVFIYHLRNFLTSATLFGTPKLRMRKPLDGVERPKVQIQNREKITMFIGQMPYDTKVDDIVPWLKAIMQRHGCAHDIDAVRLAGSGNSNKQFKGFAFVDFKTRKAANIVKKFHGTLFRGRKVSVEDCRRKVYVDSKNDRSSSGLKKGSGFVKQLTGTDTVENLVQDICNTSDGVLALTDFDDQLKSFFSVLPKDVLSAALQSIKKQATKAPPARKAQYFMVSQLLASLTMWFFEQSSSWSTFSSQGITKKVSRQYWEKRAARRGE